MALSIGFEPTTDRLTADCSAVELAEHQMRKMRKKYSTQGGYPLQELPKFQAIFFSMEAKRSPMVWNEASSLVSNWML